MRPDRGFTLMEMLVSTLISSLLFAAVFTALDQLQRWSSLFSLIVERDGNLHLAPLLLSKWIPAAGNGLAGESGVAIGQGDIAVKSDIDGPRGFPDRDLEESFEQLSIHASGGHLRVRNGSGTFQPLLSHCSALAGEQESPRLLRLILQFRTGGRSAPLVEEARLVYALRNRRSNLFP